MAQKRILYNKYAWKPYYYSFPLSEAFALPNNNRNEQRRTPRIMRNNPSWKNHFITKKASTVACFLIVVLKVAKFQKIKKKRK